MFKKGESGNPTGRPQGAKDKATKDLRESIKTFLDANFEVVQADFLKLDPVQRCQFYERLLKYAVPAMTNQSINLNYEEMTDSQIDDIVTKILSK
jgi:hypothetical protein